MGFSLSVALIGCGGGSSAPTAVSSVPSPTPPPATTLVPDPDPLIAAAGDVACDTSAGDPAICRQMDTSEVIIGQRPSAVLVLGDLAYENGLAEEFSRHYDPAWGRVKPITRPAPGNHEYQLLADARFYFDYFNGAGQATGVAGRRGEGFYSFNLGAWHIIALNSNCQHIGGCGLNSPQERFLRADLQANRAACTLAFWHHPLFSSGPNGNNREMLATWQTLEEFGVDVVLAGHDHSYERFAPQTATGVPNRDRGIREFVVGTGGRNLRQFLQPQPNSELRDSGTFGVLVMRLRPTSYEWKFVPIASQSGRDTGGDTCH